MSNFFSSSSPYYHRERKLGQTLVIKHYLEIISKFQEHPCTYKMGIWILVSQTDIGYFDDLSKHHASLVPRHLSLIFHDHLTNHYDIQCT